jgi:chaperone BCS1
MQEIIVWFKQQLAENEIFAGMLGGSVMATLLYSLKSVPYQLWKGAEWLFLRYCTIEVTLTNADLTPFLLVANWLNRVVGTNWNSVQLDFAALNDDDDCEDDRYANARKLDRALTLGYGAFGFWYKGIYVRVSRTRDGENGEERRKAETIKLRFFTRSRAIIDDVLSASREDTKPLVYTAQSWGSWRESDALVARDMDTVILPEGQKARILEDLEWFYANRSFYKRIGISCTRGYLFHGPPGTGKTTLARALASHFQRDIYLLSLGDVSSDTTLLQLVSEVEKGSFLVFEDVDVVGVVTSREEEDGEKHGRAGSVAMGTGVSLGGLLQAVDGVNASSEHVVIMTTNYPELLDQALIRPGRLDIREKIDLLSREDAERMARVYFDESFVECVFALEFPISGAEIEGVLLTEHKRRHLMELNHEHR